MADAADTDVSGGAIATALIGFVAVPLLLYLVRRRLIRHVDLNMNTASAEQAEATDGDPGADEVDARHMPQWAWREAAEGDASTRASIAPRLLREQSALRLLRQLCLADLGFGLAYALLSMLGGMPQGDAPFFDASAFGVMAGLALMGVAVLRYLLFRRQFRAYDLRRSRARQRLYDRLSTAGVWVLNLVSLTGVTVANLLYVPAMLRAIFGLRMRLFVAMGVIVGGAIAAIGTLMSDTSPNVAGSIGLLVAVLLHAAGTWMLALRMRDIPGIRLLVLRVFNIDHSSAFTFNGLMGYWRYFGNHYTVVDTSFLRQRNEANTTWTVALCFLFWGALAASTMLASIGLEKLLGHEPSWLWTAPLVIALALLGAWPLVAIGERRLGGRFLRTDKQLVARLRPLDRHPRHLDLSFRHQRVLCHVNTWFLAVAEFARRADVVMMDLRGYCDERKGCQKEIDFLFDAVPVARLLFLVDTGTDVDLVQAMLLERWQRQHKTSPNLDVAEPVIVFYVAHDNDRRDMQGILDALVAMADAPVVLAGG